MVAAIFWSDVDVVVGLVRNSLQLLRNIYVAAVDCVRARLRGRENFRVRADNDVGAVTGLLCGSVAC